jgi:hypothetical protein
MTLLCDRESVRTNISHYSMSEKNCPQPRVHSNERFYNVIISPYNITFSLHQHLEASSQLPRVLILPSSTAS